MGDPEHECGVRVRADRDPLGAEEGGGVVANQADVDELDACLPATPLQLADLVDGDPAGVHVAVLQGQPAEGDDQLAVRGHLVPRRHAMLEAPGKPPITCGRTTSSAAML